jgi:hypothetical protein
MISMPKSRWIGSRVACSIGAILVTLGALLLSIVRDPPQAASAFLTGVGAVAMGAVLIIAGIEAIWIRRPSSTSWRDGITGVVVGALIAILSGLALQLNEDKSAYMILIQHVVPLILILGAAYFGIRILINRLGN